MKVYPRPRGEYGFAHTPQPPHAGLPPPTRGIHTRDKAEEEANRSTPAHAGNTGRGAARGGEIGVYPRPRGEYMLIRVLAFPILGLPPPTRGILASSRLAKTG